MPDQTIVTEETTIGVVETASDQIAVTSETVPSVLEFGSRGPEGVQGPQGTQGIQGVPGGGAIQIPYIFSTLTADADPGNGYLRLSNATQNLSTVLRADLLASDGTDWSAVLATFADSTNAVKGHIRLSGTLTPAHWLVFTVSAVASPAGYKNVTIANVGSSSASPFADGESITLEFTRSGDRGSYGGAVTIPYTFSTTTADADPGNGVLRLDNATQNLATTIRADLLSSDGTTWTSVLDTFDLSTSTTKAQIRLSLLTDPTKWLVFNVTAMAAPAGYRNVTVTNVGSSAASPFANGDALLLAWTRVGDKGSTGTTGATGASGTQYGKNRLLNGTFRHWQRNSTFTAVADNAYIADRWRALTEAAGALNVVKSTGPVGPGGFESSDWIQLVVTATNNNKFGIIQIIPYLSAVSLAGSACSVQLKMAQFGNTIGTVKVGVMQWSAAADNSNTAFPDPIAVWGAAGTDPTLTGSWAYAATPTAFAPTTSVATYKVENVAITAGMTNVALLIWNDDRTTTAADYLYLSDVQLEKGATCTDVESRPPEQELSLCQAYHCKTFDQGTAEAQNSGTTNGGLAYVTQIAGTGGPFAVTWRFPHVMRKVPAVTTYNPSAANNKWRNVSVVADSATPTIGSIGDAGCYVYNGQVAGDVVNSQILIHASADSEL